ncbi:UDP-glycosyltransferase TURAN-like isoform X3 [Olea europaea subsp. europaea]|uniref:UDP-glycosyltransferase TURAN-like isoform X3 n=1 Tax=Olea europaea subsp. europaea TaxID=158383 RepID=A0A8S0Q354_OLEEU|nr:UDP-glycosyltransferase TURAN-like isoform X3 [Olea europaea subsp. europaea]
MFVLERASQLNFIGWISMVVLGHPGLILFTGSLIGSQLLKCLLSLTLRTRLLVQICDFDLQNPPSVPTLVGVKWASWSRHSTFIVDWHNFGYTLLALSLGRSSLFVSLYRWIEKQYGKMAHGSLCVTRAMQHELAENWGIKATVLYDQPPEFFRPASLEEKHNVRKGPEKEKYEQKIRKLNLKRVAFRTMWLSTEDYPLLLGFVRLGKQEPDFTPGNDYAALLLTLQLHMNDLEWLNTMQIHP